MAHTYIDKLSKTDWQTLLTREYYIHMVLANECQNLERLSKRDSSNMHLAQTVLFMSDLKTIEPSRNVVPQCLPEIQPSMRSRQDTKKQTERPRGRYNFKYFFITTHRALCSRMDNIQACTGICHTHLGIASTHPGDDPQLSSAFHQHSRLAPFCFGSGAVFFGGLAQSGLFIEAAGRCFTGLLSSSFCRICSVTRSNWLSF